MESPFGPSLVDINMSYIDNLSEDLFENVSLYRRYVDDIKIISDDNGRPAVSVFSRVDEVQTWISLTSVEEMDNCLSLLDLLLTRRADGSIQPSIYRKPTYTRQKLLMAACIYIQRTSVCAQLVFREWVISAIYVCVSVCLFIYLSIYLNPM